MGNGKREEALPPPPPPPLRSAGWGEEGGGMLLGDVWRGEEGGPETTCCAQKAPDVVHTTCLYEGEIKK